MRLTPLDIRKQEFSRGLRGYEADDVDAFLQMVSEQWEELLDEVRRKTEEVRELEGKLAHYEKVEEALQEALQTARESSKKSIETAEQKASLILERAEARADEIKHDAEVERHQVKRETNKLSSRKSEIVTRLRAFLMSELELLASYEGDDPVGFIKLLPSQKERIEQISGKVEERPEQSSEAPPEAEQSDRETQPSPPSEYGTRGPTQPAQEYGGSHSEELVPERDADDSAEDIPADVTAAEHADQKRYRLDDSFEGEEGTLSSGEGADRPGWTTQTFVSGSSEESRPDKDLDEAADDETSTRRSSEEIEKIRRILSDLD